MTSSRLAAPRTSGGGLPALPRFVAILVMCIALAAVLGRCFAERRGDPSGAGGEGGSAHTGASGPLTVNQTAALDDLFPGAPPQMLSGTFTNTGDAALFVGAVEATLTGVSGGQGSCSVETYRLLDRVMPVGREIPVGRDVGRWAGATVQMLGGPGAQDGCKLATLHISYVTR